MRRLTLIAVAACLGACGGNTAPTAPSIAQVGGVWTGLASQVTCNGAARDIFLAALSITATISGNAMIGTADETWNVFPRGNTTKVLGMLMVDLAFSFMHQ